MGRALSLSLAGHLTLIITFLLLSATRQPLRIPEVVRPVRLVTYLDTPPPARARAPRPVDAPSAPAAAAPRVPPATPAPPAPAPEPEPPVPAATPKFVIPTRPPAPAAPAPRPAPAPAPGASLRERLARRLADAAPAEPAAPEPAAPRLAALAPAEPPPEPVRGVPTTSAAAPAGATVVPLGNFPHAWYLTLLKEAVFARWTPPSEFYTGGRAPVALVSFRIDRAGQIDRLTLKESSGYARFDQSAIAAVRSLGRATALPDTYTEESLDVVIRFQNVK